MRIHNLYTDEKGESHFRDIDVEWAEERRGSKLSKRLPATGIIFRETKPENTVDWHNAPRRQYIVNLQSGVTITASDGESLRPCVFGLPSSVAYRRKCKLLQTLYKFSNGSIAWMRLPGNPPFNVTLVPRSADHHTPAAYLTRADRPVWPINRHSVFVHECRLSRVDRTLCAATSLARQRLFMAVNDRLTSQKVAVGSLDEKNPAFAGLFQWG